MSGQILVVDDEMGIRELLSEILADEGYDVALAENAAMAREYRQHTRPDLVLLDIWMPDMDGISLLKAWAAAGELSMPVVMMSGHGTIDTAVEATRIGAVGFLEKPIALKKLLETVANSLKHEPAKLSVTSKASDTAYDEVIARPIEQSGPTDEVSEPAAAGAEVQNNWLASMNVAMSLPLREARDLFERHYFERLIEQTAGNMSRLAEQAGVERTHLYRKLKQLGVKLPKKADQ
ncbi:two-component system response regulator [Sulfuriferula sp. AH1]|uniref:response regulator n=1 Tax=Sulfuriferula sp. AH1 TaxID=1985873 RepID=UPI000B3B7F95|nr:response regulator [Sulfuriferula sp. AH1]ARU32393.1 two-component system response regulator [Sulfuriferula sp. AH1]